ncbi:patatin-like phospholipase family protein [Alphaproteobacteria bacterium]|nr:patatin-like phospholipase family protein [Alphaproteobacteria bacterium]
MGRVVHFLAPPSLSGPGTNQRVQEHHVRLIWVFQVVVLSISMAMCLLIGTSPLFTTTALVVYVGLCYGEGLAIRKYLVTPNPLPRGALILKAMQGGVWLVTLAFWGTAWAVYLRTSFQGPLLEWIGSAGAIVILIVIGLLAFRGSSYSIQHGITPWFQFSVGLTAFPFLIAWTMASFASAVVQPGLVRGFSASALENERKQQQDLRHGWHVTKPWQKVNGQRTIVAVALSGGGYRAAAFHAGVLKALDRHCVPISYLTTVSGGSIIGAYYALGYDPDRFRNRIAQAKPRLPDTMLAIWYVAMDLFYPGWNSADTYSRHFRKTFFDSTTLETTGYHPRLIVNATDIESKPTQSREVFYRDRVKGNQQLNDTLIADVVAASAAFPGAFQPKLIPWPDPAHKDSVRTRKFVDGGVFENIGYTGLQSFLEAEHLDLPDFIILSDASAGTSPAQLSDKVDIVSLLGRSEDVTYQSRLDMLRASLPNGFNSIKLRGTFVQWINTQFDEQRDGKSTATFDVSKDKKLSLNEVAELINKIPTLHEIDETLVNADFWYGQQMMETAWPDIDKWRNVFAVGDSCSKEPAAPSPWR